MKLSEMFFESLKITWKNKPMWKFNLLVYIPVFLISFIIYVAPLMLTSLQENGLNPISLGKNGEAILSFAVTFTTILYLAVYLVGFVAIQLGSIIQCWQESNGMNISRRKDLFKAILGKILPGLPGYLVFIILPYLLIFGGSKGLIFLSESTGEPALFLLIFVFYFLFLLVYAAGIYMTYIFMPITIHEEISFKQRIKLAWLYLRSYFWDVFVYTLIVALFDFVANMIIIIPYVAITIILFIPTMLLMIQAHVNQFLLIFMIYILIVIIFGAFVAALKNFVVSAKQTAFTCFYYQKYSASNEMQKIAILSPPVQSAEL